MFILAGIKVAEREIIDQELVGHWTGERSEQSGGWERSRLGVGCRLTERYVPVVIPMKPMIRADMCFPNF